MLGERASPEQVEALREQMGPNDPLHVQFAAFLGDVLGCVPGTSLQSRQPVTAELMARYPATVELAIFAMLLASVLGILAGVVSLFGEIRCWITA